MRVKVTWDTERTDIFTSVEKIDAAAGELVLRLAGGANVRLTLSRVRLLELFHSPVWGAGIGAATDPAYAKSLLKDAPENKPQPHPESILGLQARVTQQAQRQFQVELEWENTRKKLKAILVALDDAQRDVTHMMGALDCASDMLHRLIRADKA